MSEMIVLLVKILVGIVCGSFGVYLMARLGFLAYFVSKDQYEKNRTSGNTTEG